MSEQNTLSAEGVAELQVRLGGTRRQKPEPWFGSCRGAVTVVAEDDGHLADFLEYMPCDD